MGLIEELRRLQLGRYKYDGALYEPAGRRCGCGSAGSRGRGRQREPITRAFRREGGTRQIRIRAGRNDWEGQRWSGCTCSEHGNGKATRDKDNKKAPESGGRPQRGRL